MSYLLQGVGTQRGNSWGGKSQLVKGSQQSKAENKEDFDQKDKIRKDLFMNTTDPLADMLTRIRNACKARHKKVDIPSSKMKKRIAQLLLEHNFISNFVEVEDNKQNLLRIFLKYDHENKSFISGLRRISKPSLRIYADKKQLDQVRREVGFTILSTSKGILTHHQAREAQVGGEVLFKVW